MLDLILGSRTQETIITVAIIAALVAVFYFFNKFKPTQALVGIIAFAALVVSAVFSFGHLNIYYSAKGGTFGAITSILKKNEVVIEETEQSIDFNFKNVVLMENIDGKYSASITSTKKLKLNANESYFIYVNDQPCSTVSCEERDIYATYSYTFLNRDAGEYLIIADDVMTFYFAFYDNYSYLYIEVENGEITHQLWNQYFNKNDFKVKIQVVDGVYEPIEEQDKVIKDHIQITYVIDETLVPKKELYCISNESITLPTKYVEDNFYIIGWVDENGNEITSISLDRATNITVYAQTKETTSLYKVNFYNQLGTEIVKTNYYEFDDIELSSRPTLEDVYPRDAYFGEYIYCWTTAQCGVVGVGDDLSSYPAIRTIEDLILNFEAGIQEFNLYPVVYSNY